jgi:hypothetical protein
MFMRDPPLATDLAQADRQTKLKLFSVAVGPGSRTAASVIFRIHVYSRSRLRGVKQFNFARFQRLGVHGLQRFSFRHIFEQRLTAAQEQWLGVHELQRYADQTGTWLFEHSCVPLN